MLMTGKAVEFLDAGLNIVTGDALALHDGGDIHLLLVGFVGFDDLLWDIETQILLGLHHRDPELALQDDASFCGPDIGNGGGGVAFG